MDAMNHSIAAVERTFGYTFNNKAILWEALQAPGSDGVSLIPDRNVSLSISREGNKRLAIVGDAGMTRLIARKWYATYELKSSYDGARQTVSNLKLEPIFDTHGLKDHYQMNPSQVKQGVQAGMKTKATTVEAIIGAIALDGGDDAVVRVMETLKLLPM